MLLHELWRTILRSQGRGTRMDAELLTRSGVMASSRLFPASGARAVLGNVRFRVDPRWACDLDRKSQRASHVAKREKAHLPANPRGRHAAQGRDRR